MYIWLAYDIFRTARTLQKCLNLSQISKNPDYSPVKAHQAPEKLLSIFEESEQHSCEAFDYYYTYFKHQKGNK